MDFQTTTTAFLIDDDFATFSDAGNQQLDKLLFRAVLSSFHFANVESVDEVVVVPVVVVVDGLVGHDAKDFVIWIAGRRLWMTHEAAPQ